ncbi:SPFH domain-containing protein [Hamadaea tsunoensis]|uniref:SPFH domain-containing protein n=1 Tax=Hamadaea tsunoensis TaxID=53368 RepID=UPI00041064D4|nr:SPFH domain-containing protein [Hamadaea tsunoensis]
MGAFVFLIVLMIIAIGGIVLSFRLALPSVKGKPAPNRAARLALRAGSTLVLLIAVASLFATSAQIVPTRTVAVETSFGKPVGTLRNGFHFVPPWAGVEQFDATIQTLKLSGEQGDHPGVLVRLANAATARVDVTVQWQIDPNANIVELYSDYRNFDNIQDNVVKRQLASALNGVFERYDPLVSLTKVGGEQTPLSSLADGTRQQLAAAMPPGVVIRSVTIPSVRFDDNIQAKINQYLAAVAETQIAEQRQKTAEAQKKANDLLAAANNTTGVLYQNCLDMVERMVKDGRELPAGFSCGTPPTTVVPVK